MKGFFKSEWTGKWEVGLTIGQCYQWGGDGGWDKAGKTVANVLTKAQRTHIQCG